MEAPQSKSRPDSEDRVRASSPRTSLTVGSRSRDRESTASGGSWRGGPAASGTASSSSPLPQQEQQRSLADLASAPVSQQLLPDAADSGEAHFTLRVESPQPGWRDTHEGEERPGEPDGEQRKEEEAMSGDKEVASSSVAINVEEQDHPPPPDADPTGGTRSSSQDNAPEAADQADEAAPADDAERTPARRGWFAFDWSNLYNSMQDTALPEAMCHLYATKGPGNCPGWCTCCGVLLVLVITVLGGVLMPWTLETGFDAFLKTDVPVSAKRDAFKEALASRDGDARRLASVDGEVIPGLHAGGRHLQALEPTKLYWFADLEVAYELRETSKRRVYNHDVLNQIAQVESTLTGLAEWRRLCSSSPPDMRRLCDPGISFARYALPRLTIAEGDIVPTMMNFTGFGQPVPLETATRLVEQHGVDEFVLPKDVDVSTYLEANVMRSVFRFKRFCCTSYDSASLQSSIATGFSDEWENFVEDDLLPTLETFELEDIRVYYAGNDIQGIEFMTALRKDLLYAIGSIGCVLAYLLLHTRSVLLACMGILIIALSIPFSYVLFVVLAGTSNINLAFFLSAFLVVGLGSDIVFIYTDFWRDSAWIETSIQNRVVWTLARAGKASLASSVTTAISFFANLAMVLKPLRQFGFFMGLCVMTVWFLMAMLFMPSCILEARTGCGGGRPRHSQGPRQPGARVHCLKSWVRRLHKVRQCGLFVPMLFAILMLTWALLTAEVDGGVPNIFPANHNQNRGQDVLADFQSISQIMDNNFFPKPESAEICSEHNFRLEDARFCALFWCEVMMDSPYPTEDTCECYREENPQTCSPGDRVSATQRIVATDTVSQEQMTGPLADFIVSGGQGVDFASQTIEYSMSKTEMAPLQLLVWETGADMLRSMTEVKSTLVRHNDSSTCGWKDLCFCGTYVCKLPAQWQRLPYQLQLEPFAEPPRRLQTQLVPANRRAEVDVVFGLEVDTSMPLLGDKDLAASWNFDPSHDMAQPWAQRNLYSFCTELEEDLLVVTSICWITSFKQYISYQYPDERFPVPASLFNDRVATFAVSTLTGERSSRDYLWMQDGAVKASYFTFQLNMDEYGNTANALDLMKKWDSYADTWNANARSFARGVFHVSALWVRAAAQNELVTSTVSTLGIVLIMAFATMLCFTRDIVLSLYVVLATVGVISGLTWFIVVLMNWKIGAIEVIALIVFIGYAVTYSLHIAHKYGSVDALDEQAHACLYGSQLIRFQRVTFALKSIGGAAMGSAITTAGCSVFLLLCSLTIFQKLGGVVLAVTIMSIFTALVPLPAALLLSGPTRPGCIRMPSVETFRNLADSTQGPAMQLNRVLAQYMQAPSEPMTPVNHDPHPHPDPGQAQEIIIVEPPALLRPEVSGMVVAGAAAEMPADVVGVAAQGPEPSWTPGAGLGPEAQVALAPMPYPVAMPDDGTATGPADGSSQERGAGNNSGAVGRRVSFVMPVDDSADSSSGSNALGPSGGVLQGTPVPPIRIHDVRQQAGRQVPPIPPGAHEIENEGGLEPINVAHGGYLAAPHRRSPR